MLTREPYRRNPTACYARYDLATVLAAIYFLSLLLATSWPILRYAITECMLILNFLVTFLLLTTNTALCFSSTIDFVERKKISKQA